MKTKNRKKDARNLYFASTQIIGGERCCPNCKESLPRGGGHFVPPMFNTDGFFICDTPLKGQNV